MITTKTHLVSDSISQIETKIVQLPIKNITIIESPCKDSILQPINQTLKVGNTLIKLSEEDGDLVAEIEQKADTTTTIRESRIHNETQTESIKETVIKYRTAKFWWWVLGYSLLLTIWTLRKFIPYLNLIPF